MKIKCKICGFKGWSIVSHLRSVHNILIPNYLKQFPNAEIISQSTKKRTSKSCTGKGRPRGTPMSVHQKEFLRKLNTGHGNAFFGKKHSKKTKKRMSKNHANFSGNNNPLKKAILNNPSLRKLLSQEAIKRWENYSPEKRKEMSEKLSKAIANSPKMQNARCHKYHRSGHIQTTKGGRAFYRSSWEKTVLDCLEESKDVVCFSLDKLCIPYNINGATRHTRIDFVVILSNGKKIVLDVKPLSMIAYHNNKEKMNGTKQYCLANGIQYFPVTSNDKKVVEQIISQVINEC